MKEVDIICEMGVEVPYIRCFGAIKWYLRLDIHIFTLTSIWQCIRRERERERLRKQRYNIPELAL